MDIIRAVRDGFGILYISAHPDDEGAVGPLLAFAADYSSATVLCLTSGESGRNVLQTDESQTLGMLRQKELEKSCNVLGASWRVLGYTNGLSKAHPKGLAVAESKEQAVARRAAIDELAEKPDHVIARWTLEAGDPAPEIEKAILKSAPCLVITLEAKKGFTGHTEHIAVARIVERVVAGISGRRTAHDRTELWQAVHPRDFSPGDATVDAHVLEAQGRRPYLALGIRAQSMHESQFGPLGSETSGQFISMFASVMERMILRRPAPSTISSR